MQQDTSTQQSCLLYLEKMRWGKNVKCPYCLSIKTHPSKSEAGRHFCYNCIKSFSVLVGTIFEDTRLALPIWFNIIKATLKSKKLLPAKKLAKENEITIKTAWLTAMKIRCAMIDSNTVLSLKPQRNSFRKVKKPEATAISRLSLLKQYIATGKKNSLGSFLKIDEAAALFFNIHLNDLNQAITNSQNETFYLQTIINTSSNFLNSNFSSFYFAEFEYKFKRKNKKYGLFTEYLRKAVSKEPFIKINTSKAGKIKI